MLSIKKNNKPDLTICRMNCDNGLHKKLDEYDLTRFMNGHHTNLFIGKPRSGKTSLLYSLFKSKKLFKKVFQKIYLFQPSASRSSMTDNIFSVLPEEQIFIWFIINNRRNGLNVFFIYFHYFFKNGF